MIEFKKREFKISIGTSNLENTIFLQGNELFEYEIHKDIKNSRLEKIIEFFINLFNGASIKFNLANVVCDLEFFNHIEKFKFETILETLNKYIEITKIFNLHKDKDFTNIQNSFYEIFLLHKFLILKENSMETWINSNLENKNDLESGDILEIRRFHKLNFKNLTFDIVEKISFKDSISDKEIISNKIRLSRKLVTVSVEQVQKI